MCAAKRRELDTLKQVAIVGGMLKWALLPLKVSIDSTVCASDGAICAKLPNEHSCFLVRVALLLAVLWLKAWRVSAGRPRRRSRGLFQEIRRSKPVSPAFEVGCWWSYLMPKPHYESHHVTRRCRCWCEAEGASWLVVVRVIGLLLVTTVLVYTSSYVNLRSRCSNIALFAAHTLGLLLPYHVQRQRWHLSRSSGIQQWESSESYGQ